MRVGDIVEGIAVEWFRMMRRVREWVWGEGRGGVREDQRAESRTVGASTVTSYLLELDIVEMSWNLGAGYEVVERAPSRAALGQVCEGDVGYQTTTMSGAAGLGGFYECGRCDGMDMVYTDSTGGTTGHGATGAFQRPRVAKIK
jgi:hypothetical protein